MPVSTLFIGLFALLLVPLTMMVGYRSASMADFVMLESAFMFLHYLVFHRLRPWHGATRRDPAMPHGASLAEAMRSALKGRKGIILCRASRLPVQGLGGRPRNDGRWLAVERLSQKASSVGNPGRPPMQSHSTQAMPRSPVHSVWRPWP